MTDVRYDVELAIAEVRLAMRRSDPVSLQTVVVAEDYAKTMRAQFEGRDLRLVVETLLTSSAMTGGLWRPSDWPQVQQDLLRLAGRKRPLPPIGGGT